MLGGLTLQAAVLALSSALRLLQGLHGVAGVACRFPQLPQPLGQLHHAGVQRVQTDVQLVQACVQAGQAAHCGRTKRTLEGEPGDTAKGPEDRVPLELLWTGLIGAGR